jgi:hypothetical protein
MPIVRAGPGSPRYCTGAFFLHETRCVDARRKKRRFRGDCRFSCPSHLQEPADAGVLEAFPEAVHARKSWEAPGTSGTLRGEVTRRSRRRRRSGVRWLRPPMGGTNMLSAHGPPPENRSNESRGVRRRALLPGENYRHRPLNRLFSCSFLRWPWMCPGEEEEAVQGGNIHALVYPMSRSLRTPVCAGRFWRQLMPGNPWKYRA